MSRFFSVIFVLATISGTPISAHAEERLAAKYCLPVLDEEFLRAGDTVYAASVPMTPQERSIFEEVQQYLVRYNVNHADDPDRMPGVTENSVISVKFGKNFAKKWSVLLNMKSDVRPRIDSIGDDPFYHGLSTGVGEMIGEKFPHNLAEDDPCSDNGPSVFIIFNSKTLHPDDYRTEEWLKARGKQKRGSATSIGTLQVAESVVVNSGHGRYLTYADPADPVWDWQRPLVNGVREDIVTISFGRKLGQFLDARSGADVTYARDQDNTEIDPETNLAWWKVAAR